MAKKKPSGRLDELELERCSDKQAELRETLIATAKMFNTEINTKKKKQAAVVFITISNTLLDCS